MIASDKSAGYAVVQNAGISFLVDVNGNNCASFTSEIDALDAFEERCNIVKARRARARLMEEHGS